MKTIMGSHLTHAAKLSNDWGPPLLGHDTTLMFNDRPMNTTARQNEVQFWLEECRAVRGQVAVLWHPHTLTAEYAWGEGFQQTLTEMSKGRT